MACRVPVIASDVGGIPEVVLDGINGYLVRPGDPLALAERIIDLIASVEKRRDFGQHARERVATEFTFTAQSAQYEELFECIAANRPRRRVQRVGQASGQMSG
jgi:glycosyltransferase involved in cell wall biosynthesis